MKTTLATIKSFVKRETNIGQLYVKCETSFDGMVDCVMPVNGSQFSKVEGVDLTDTHKLGIQGAWFVGQSRDYFRDYADDNFIGYEIYNCCGKFILAIPRR